MHINTTARHFELDPEDRLYAHERLGKLSRFARDIQEAHLVVTAEGYRHSAEITLKLKRHEMVSKEESVEPRLAIERAAERLEKQLRRLKEKRLARKRPSRSENGRLKLMAPDETEALDESGEGTAGEG
jgi:ribosomal subunit interface protein